MRPTATAVPLSVCGVCVRLPPPPRTSHADVQAPSLVVGGVRARRQLAIAALAGQPRLAVVLLGRRAAEVGHGDVDHAIGQARAPSGSPPRSRVSARARLGRLLGRDEAEHLDLVELMHPEDPARVLAGGARLAAEARREARRSEAAGPLGFENSPSCSDASATSEVPTRNSSSAGSW